MDKNELETALTDIKTQIDTHIKSVKTDVAESGKVSDEAIKSLNEAIKSQSDLVKSTRAEMTELFQKQSIAPAAAVARKSLGNTFVESDVFKTLSKTQRGDNQGFNINKKAITLGSTSAGPLTTAYKDPTVYSDPKRSIRIRDLISIVPVSDNAVEYARQTSNASNAGPQENEFDSKNESSITWELITDTCKTIAHWVAASRQALSDAPQLASLIDVDLTYGLQLEADTQLLLGTGTSGDMTGLLVDTDIPTVGDIAFGTTDALLASSMIDHIRSAVTVCQKSEYYNMTGIVLNPTDWETLETAKATDGHYLMIQFPANGGEERIWKMPVVVTNAMPVGTFILGDWMMGAKIYDRESIEIRASESHSDYFIKNGVAILAEERYVLGIQRPNAFCKGSFEVSTTDPDA